MVLRRADIVVFTIYDNNYLFFKKENIKNKNEYIIKSIKKRVRFSNSKRNPQLTSRLLTTQKMR